MKLKKIATIKAIDVKEVMSLLKKISLDRYTYRRRSDNQWDIIKEVEENGS